MTDEERKNWLTSKEAAALLGLPLRRLQEKCRNGSIPCRYVEEQMSVRLTRVNLYIPAYYVEFAKADLEARRRKIFDGTS